MRKKLGEFKYFTRHGYSKRKSGRLWTEDEILKVEEEYRIIDLLIFHTSLLAELNFLIAEATFASSFTRVMSRHTETRLNM